MKKYLMILCVLLVISVPLLGFMEADPEIENYTRYTDYEPQKADPTGLIPGEFIAFAMPTAGMASTFADTFNGDVEGAAIQTLGTTILSVISIPLLYTLLCTVLGV